MQAEHCAVDAMPTERRYALPTARDSATWPNMAPKIRYRRTELLSHGVFLGAAYGLVASALPMRYAGLSSTKKGPAKAIAFNRALSPAANVGVERGRRGYCSS